MNNYRLQVDSLGITLSKIQTNLDQNETDMRDSLW
jgi:hypothetical protein